MFLYFNCLCVNVQKIGMAYINHLVEKGDYDAAARYRKSFRSISKLDICDKCLSISLIHFQKVSESAREEYGPVGERGVQVQDYRTIEGMFIVK